MINYIDFLSPPITLYHLERRTHTSMVGGFLVIIMLGLIFTYISFLLYQLFSFKNMISIFHKKYQFEVGSYSFNSSSIFNFIQFFTTENGGYFAKYDSKYIRIYTTYVHSNYSEKNLDLYDHWVFDTCQNNDKKDLDPSLFSNVVNFTNSACIRYYYNSTEKKYYSFGDKNFFWPFLEYGTSQKNNIFLKTIVQKCNNFSSIKGLFGDCPPQKEIDEYLSKYLEIYLYFTDIQVDPTNYKYPLQKYLQVINTKIGSTQLFEENHIYYSPLKIITREGNIFGKTRDINAFYFDFNRKENNVNNDKNYTITQYYHFMQNNVQIYERIYNNIFDLFSEIGGVVQFTFYIFFWSNYIYNKYIIAYDTYSLFFSVQNEQQHIKKGSFLNYNNKIYNINKNNKFLKENNNKKIKKKNENNYTSLRKTKTEFIFFENSKKTPKNSNAINIKTNYLSKEKYYKIFRNINKKFETKRDGSKKIIDNNSSNANLKENNILINIQNLSCNEGKNEKRYLSNKERINRIILSQKSLGRIEHNKIKFQENIENIKIPKHFAFIDFIKSFCFKKNKGSHNFLITFRKHLLSEEHLFKNHIKIVLLEKHQNCNLEEKTNIWESYNEL